MSAKAVFCDNLRKMIKRTFLDKNIIKTKLFYPYPKYREYVLSHLENYIARMNDECVFSMFGDGEGGDFLFDPLEEDLIKKARLIIEEDRSTFLCLYADWDNDKNEDEEAFLRFLLEYLAQEFYMYDIGFHYEFNNILFQLEKHYKKEVIEKIAFNKIKRNELFVLGLSMKISMRDCGIALEAY